MPRKRRQRNNEDDQARDKEQIAKITKRRLAFLILFFLVIILVLIFRIGDNWWFGWLLEYRKRFIGLMLFAEILLILWSPVIVEADTNPRPLSGPGKNPKGPWGP